MSQFGPLSQLTPMKRCMIEIPAGVQEELSRLRRDFPDEQACEAYLFRMRWPNGFVCPEPDCCCCSCAPLKSRAFTYQCSLCRRQTSITAGTLMHRSKLPLTIWFSAAGLIATDPKSISWRLLEVIFGISRQSARLLMRKFEQILAAFDGEPLEGLVAVDQCEVQLRAANGAVNNSASGRVIVAAAIEMRSGHIRVAELPDDSTESLGTFVQSNVKRGERLLTRVDLGLNGYSHDPRGIGKISLGLGMERMLTFTGNWLRKHHGLRREDVEDALAEFVVRENNRRRARYPSFDTLIRFALERKPISHWEMMGRDNPRKGIPTARRNSRYRKTATGMRQDGSGSTRPFRASAVPRSG